MKYSTKTGIRLLAWPLALLWLLAAAAHAMPGMGNQGGPQLGVVVQQMPFATLQDMGIPYGVGVRRVVPDSSAAAAGVKSGDVLVSLNDSPVYSPARLQWLVGRMPTGKAVELEVRRDGEAKTLEVTFKEGTKGQAMGRQEPGIAHLGVSMTSLTEDLRQSFDVPPGQGVLVTEVTDDGPAAAGGVKAGDVLVKIDKRDIGGPRDVLRAVHFFDPGDKVEVKLIRDGETVTKEVTLGRAELPDWFQGMRDMMQQGGMPGMMHDMPHHPMMQDRPHQGGMPGMMQDRPHQGRMPGMMQDRPSPGGQYPWTYQVPPWYGKQFHSQPPRPYGPGDQGGTGDRAGGEEQPSDI